MRQWLVGAIVFGSIFAGLFTELAMLRLVNMPDTMAAIFGSLWVMMPYVACVGLTVPYRKNKGALIVLLLSVLVVALVGLSLLDSSATQQEIARKQADNAVLPGEDPNHGPSGMRKAGADAGVAIGGLFSVLLAVVLPPIQLLAVTIPAMIWSFFSGLLRRRERNINTPPAANNSRLGANPL